MDRWNHDIMNTWSSEASYDLPSSRYSNDNSLAQHQQQQEEDFENKFLEAPLLQPSSHHNSHNISFHENDKNLQLKELISESCRYIEENETTSFYQPNSNNINTGSSCSSFHTVAGLAGNLLEWYDFACYGYFSDVIGDVIFPNASGNTEVTLSFLIFGSAFVARPFGALMFGYIGDKFGAKRALEISMIMMSLSTFGFGLIPSYDEFNWFVFLLLMSLRLVQGFSVGGQQTSSWVYSLQNRNTQHWGLYGSFGMTSVNFGTWLASLVTYIMRNTMSYQHLKDYGWRIPFFFGILLSFPAFYFVSKDDITERSKAETSKEFNPIMKAFKAENFRSLTCITLVSMLGTSSFNLSFIFMAIYMKDLVEPPVDNAFLINTVALFFSMCLFMPIPGFFSDKYGHKEVMIIGAIIISVLGPLTLHVTSTGSNFGTFFSQLFLGFGICCWSAPMAAWMMERFSPEIRLTSISVGYNISAATIGGFSPAVATLMANRISLESPGILYISLSVLSVFGLLYAPQKPLQQSTPIL